jgi:hypothetical protein
MKRPAVVGCDDGDRCDPEWPARPKDPHGDLAAVRYQQALHPAGL